MDLRREDLASLNRLGDIWKTTPGAEFEAMLINMDLTAWQDVIQYLRSLGMRERPQIVRLNISLSNNLRFTLEGAGVIQAYCRDNRIADKPFTVMLKENIQEGEPVLLTDYSAKTKLKREVPLSADDAQVKEAVRRWDQLGKHFRMIQRFEFQAPKGLPLRFDISLVRENAGRPARTFQEARVTMTPQTYEAEVELTAKREGMEGEGAARLILRGLSWLLQGRQRAFVLVGNRRADIVRGDIAALFGLGSGSSNARSGRNRVGPTRSFRFPGPQPATLERRHMLEIGVDYNVTDKADGLRCLLYVSDIGRIYLVDGGGRVYATGKQTEKALAGTVLDGEWIRRDRTGKSVSHYYAFDIMAKAGDVRIASQPFMIPGAMLGSAAEAGTRMAAMKEIVAGLSAAKQLVKGVPVAHDLQVGMKMFRTAEGTAIFREAAAATLDAAQRAPYTTDGLIFTPNAAPLPIGQGTWAEQLKWKPPQENTIDFLVVVDSDRDKAGVPLGTDAIGMKYREDTGQTVRYKSLRLFVGSNKDVAYADPRRTVLEGEPLPASTQNGEWVPVEFRPVDPRDPMAAVCYVPIDAGVADPAGATPAAVALDPVTDVIRTTRTADIIQSDMIVEMAYHPERAPGWRWEPVRVRHDKTERWRAGRTSGTMNADWVANSIWTTLHNPITEAMIRTGVVENCVAVSTITRGRRTRMRAPMKVQCMTNFIEDIVKRMMLFRPTLTAGSTVCDLGMGYGDNIASYIVAKVGYVLGVDVNDDALNNPVDGAYRRLLDKMVALGGRDRVPPMVFAQANAAGNLPSGSAGMTKEDQALLQREFTTGAAAGGFDVVVAMFSLQYMFSDVNTLDGFLNTLADTVKVGGYVIGCAPDGDAIAAQFAKNPKESSIMGRDGKAEVWSMRRRYGSNVDAMVPTTNEGVGLAVDVDFIAGGQIYTQYLVSWPYLKKRMAEAGLELLTADEIAAAGLPASSQMFGETWSIAEAAGDVYAMTEAIRQLAFMNRWWIFRRRSDVRPAPPSAEPAAPAALTKMKPETDDATDVTDMPPAMTATDVIEMAPAVMEEAPAVMEEAPAVTEIAETEATPALAITEMEPAPFLVDMSNRTPDMRLGPDLADWPRYMSLGAITSIPDAKNPSIIYPSIEAAIASAKYQYASAIPEMGPQLFRVEGTLHQKFDTERKANSANADVITENQVTKTRIESGKNKINSYGGKFDMDKWLAIRESIYATYLQARYASDERFRQMVDAIRAQGGEILMANGREPNDLGVGVAVDGTVLGGGNLIGKMMMRLGDEKMTTSNI